MEATEVSATGVRSQAQAVLIADGFAQMHTSNFAVLYYPTLKEFDIEPAKTFDAVGDSFVTYIARPTTEESA